MSRTPLTDDDLALLADRFKVLAEPARLRILNTLRHAERAVTDIVDATRLGQANVSRHLQVLHAQGFVTRRKDGARVLYALADPSVFQLCDLMCVQLGRQTRERRRVLRA